jgi:hypothetical protein
MKRLLAVALFVVAGCGGGSSLSIADPSNAIRSQEPLTTEDALATEAMATEPASDPPAAADLPVRVTKPAGTVARGAVATLVVKTVKNASCDINVEYDSGTGTAKGLADKKTDSSGNVTWKWTVGRNTHKGEVPISILCSLGFRSGGVDTSFTVK